MSKKQLRALSIRQPYAEQILNGDKEFEYRSVNTRIRGRVYIYASLSMGNSDEIEEGADMLEMSVEEFKKMPRGVLVGTVEITESDGEDGEYAWRLENPVRFKKPLKPNPEEHPQPIWFYPFGRPTPRVKARRKTSSVRKKAKRKASPAKAKKKAKRASSNRRKAKRAK